MEHNRNNNNNKHMKTKKWFKVWRKVKGSYYQFIGNNGVSPIDVTKYNKKTGYVTWLEFK